MLGQIERAGDEERRGLRCSGCGWPASLLGPAVPMVSFGALLHRGRIIDKISAAPVEPFDDLVLCGECCFEAALQIDPHPGRAVREKAAEEQQRLRNEIAAIAKRRRGVQAEIKDAEKRLADLEATRDTQERLRASVQRWASSHAEALRTFRDAQFQEWAMIRSAVGDESPETAAELEAAREAPAKARDALRALTLAGERLAGQCEEKALGTEHAAIRNQLRFGQEDDFDG